MIYLNDVQVFHNHVFDYLTIDHDMNHNYLDKYLYVN